MQLSHTRPVVSAEFDEPNLVSLAVLVPVMALARSAGLQELADERLTVPTDKGANAGVKISSLVAGMVAGADSIDDMALLRHGGMGRVFAAGYAPSTLGSFLRSFTFGHVRQADAVASRFLLNLAERTELLGTETDTAMVMVDIDDTIIEVHGYQKQGAAFGYSGVRGLNTLLAIVSTDQVAPVIAAQRLRQGSAGSPRGAARLAADTLALVRRTHLPGRDVLVGRDSAFYSHALVTAAMKAGANVSITVRMDPAVKRTITAIDADAWTAIRYTDSIYDETTGVWISRAEVAEIGFTAFSSKKKADQITGRLVVRRIPDVNPKKDQGQDALFQTWRFHAFFTTTPTASLGTVTADQVHRQHAIIENVHADLKASALAHQPSGVFTANANLTRAAATLTKAPALARATSATIRRTLIAVPARIATSARRLTCTHPPAGPGKPRGARSTTRCSHSPPPGRPDHQHTPPRTGTPVERPDRPAASSRPNTTTTSPPENQLASPRPSVDRG